MAFRYPAWDERGGIGLRTLIPPMPPSEPLRVFIS